MYTRFFNPPSRQSFFMFGPRGVGKSRWVREHYRDMPYVDLLHAQTFRELLANPSRLEERIPPKSKWVVIDEIQKIPSLLDEVHRLIESRGIHFVLTGSSARKLKAKGTNLLAGRALSRQMFPLTAEELGDDFDFHKSLRIGHLPMAYAHENALEYLHSYVQTYLREEILQEGILRNLSGFSRFLEAASFSQGQVLNISKVATDAHVDRKVTEEYFRILEDLLLSIRLPVFQRKASRKTTVHPKFFFFDCGVFRAIRPMGPLDVAEETEGAAIETLVLQELRALNAYHQWGFEFFCWSLSQGPDVDFILYGKRGLLAFEVKRSARLRGGELKGLKAFKELYKMATPFYIYGGRERRHIDGIQIVPAADFFKNCRNYIEKAT